MTVIICSSGRAPRLLGIGRRKRAVRKDYLTLKIDGATLTSKEPYKYMKDSTVSSIEPINTIYHGGTIVKVTGTNLDIVQDPRIGVIVETYEELEVSSAIVLHRQIGLLLFYRCPSFCLSAQT